MNNCACVQQLALVPGQTDFTDRACVTLRNCWRKSGKSVGIKKFHLLEHYKYIEAVIGDIHNCNTPILTNRSTLFLYTWPKCQELSVSAESSSDAPEVNATPNFIWCSAQVRQISWAHASIMLSLPWPAQNMAIAMTLSQLRCTSLPWRWGCPVV